jgi:glycerol-3-phosphate dehydrogenase (NAD(P)+)
MPGAPIAVLSGPSFAAEVARGLPAAVTLACADEALGEELMWTLSAPGFRPYLANDLIGAEAAGRSRTSWPSPAASSRAGVWAEAPTPP